MMSQQFSFTQAEYFFRHTFPDIMLLIIATVNHAAFAKYSRFQQFYSV